ncbi:hypothetical protein AAHA92_05234 [Salvia divinorum]|uniref:Uncharacterized protein n=1 Tax=Salvia divinorum TaxID=28513 RepID=A0ABD1I1S8_SALDI
MHSTPSRYSGAGAPPTDVQRFYQIYPFGFEGRLSLTLKLKGLILLFSSQILTSLMGMEFDSSLFLV